MLTTWTPVRLPVPAPALHHAESAARAHRADWQHRNGDMARGLRVDDGDAPTTVAFDLRNIVRPADALRAETLTISV